MTRSLLIELARAADNRKVPAEFAVIHPSLLVSRPIPHIGAHSLGAADVPSGINSVIVYVFLSEKTFDYYVRDEFTSIFLERLREKRPECRSVYDDYLILRKETAALAGLGLSYLPEELALPHLEKGRLKRVLEDWCPPYAGYHLYYPSRRQPSAAFALFVDALRYRG